MLFRNYTPFPPLQFQSRDEQQRDFGVVVLRGTFALVNGEPLRLVQEQAPIVMTDEYWGEPGASSLRLESNLAPYKPKTDIHVTATAQAPGTEPANCWQIGVEVGLVRKKLLVTGHRYWHLRPGEGWRLSDTIPVRQVPIRYELAFGGTRGEGGPATPCAENPVGVGRYPETPPDGSKPLPAPQVLAPDAADLRLGEHQTPQGLGPLAPAWQPRLGRVGTFDMIWEKTRWPDLPADFSFAFYNSAHPDLVYPGFVKGDESIALINLHPISRIHSCLPGFELALLLRWEDGRIAPAPVVLDTIHIDAEQLRVYLTWRGIFPVNRPLRVLEVRMRTPADRARQDAATAAQGDPPPPAAMD
ncbi:DUF2169 domain-containing protein [uncultured Thiodictyon sp.]|jgi:hypothetical protein|uniref:DUF2169 family type VI secretion system accessory protein n=1 Tax=uncultured Thiodictyon sp. TaxID=1846217 RepID=UPI0025DFA578|nr:DUF2169 domain-containing protein [uncultured Thiodictyon sp.]